MLAILPVEYQPEDGAVVLPAIVSAIRDLNITVHAASALAAGQADIGRSTGMYLSQHGEDRETFRAEGEDEEVFRVRLLDRTAPVTRDAIVAAVNAVLARYTTVECQVFESIQDRWFVATTGATNSWTSHVGRNPSYPDRMYEDTPTPHRPNSMPGGARVFVDTIGRLFCIRLPDLTGIESMTAFPRHAGGTVAPGWFLRTGALTGMGRQVGYALSRSASALSIYQEIASAIESLKGQSIAWNGFIEDMVY